MADGLWHSQDVLIQSLKIVGENGSPIDVKDIVVEINYFEDIFSNFVSGALVINDSVGIIQMFQFQGQEMLILSIDKPGLGKPLEKNLRIYTHSNRTQTKTSNENFVLHFCSEEAILNEQYKVSKSYNNKKILEILKDITKTYLKIDDKHMKTLDETMGIVDLVVPNLKPLQAINWLTTIAKADQAKNEGAFYLFYEDKEGFNFRSVLNLYKEAESPFRSYKYEEKLLHQNDELGQDMNKEFINALGYEHINAFDSVSAVRSGSMANKTITIDPLRLKFGEKDFNYDEYNKKVQQLDKQPIQATATNRKNEKLTETFGAVKFCISTTGQSENKYIKEKGIQVNEHKPEETTSIRTAQLSLMWCNRIKLVVPGDIEMTIGKVVDFKKPEISYNDQNSKEKKDDPFYAGKYLVTAVRHIINQENRFITVLELCKDAYPNRHGSFDNSDPGWKGVR